MHLSAPVSAQGLVQTRYCWLARVSTFSMGGDNIGVFYLPSFLDSTQGTRSDARINRYDLIKETRPNYHILPNTTVAKVLFNVTEAVGVQYLPSVGGDISQVTARKEILLAAGGVHIPHILQLSGIGPRALLDTLGIATLSELPGVGQSLQDHATLTISYNFANNVTPNQGSLDTNTTYLAEQLELYWQDHRGAFTIVHPLSPNIASVALYNSTSDCQVIINTIKNQDPASYLPAHIDAAVFKAYQRQIQIVLDQLHGISSPIGQIHWSTTTTSTLYFVKPLSRGSSNIHVTYQLSSPVINWWSMTNPVDLDLMMVLFRKHQRMAYDYLGPPTATIYGQSEKIADIINNAYGLA